MREIKRIEWTTSSGREIHLSMYYYPHLKEMQFDLKRGLDLVTSNITIKQAKEIRDRLNEFIAECEK